MRHKQKKANPGHETWSFQRVMEIMNSVCKSSSSHGILCRTHQKEANLDNLYQMLVPCEKERPTCLNCCMTLPAHATLGLRKGIKGLLKD